MVAGLMNIYPCADRYRLAGPGEAGPRHAALVSRSPRVDISIGSIVGAFAVGYICRKVFADFVITAGIVVIGLGVAVFRGFLIPRLPIIMMFLHRDWRAMLANIPLNTQMTLAMPDEFRHGAVR